MIPRCICVLVMSLLVHATAAASYAIYVGKNLTADGSVFIGGSGDEVSSHWLEVVPARDHPEGTTVTVGVTPEAFMPGELMQIPQARVAKPAASAERGCRSAHLACSAKFAAIWSRTWAQPCSK